MITLRTGNLGVLQLRAAFADEPLPDGDAIRAELPEWRELGFDQVEDYVSWAVAEPAMGCFDWTLYRDNARAARAAGLEYHAYLWLHASPPWYRGGEHFAPSTCVEHGCRSLFPSLFAPATWEATARFYRAVAAGLGDVLSGVVIGFPADYGEVGYTSGIADWIFLPREERARSPHHLGYWCGEPAARAAFAKYALALHGSRESVARAWELSAVPGNAFPYPGDDASPAHWRDFARFYNGGASMWVHRALALACEVFPGLPREFKIGHCSEALPLGRDLGDLVRAAAEFGATVRSTQSGMGELFTARLASLCRTWGVPFATEAPREIAHSCLVERVFVDAVHGSSSYFEYPEQLLATREAFRAVSAAARAGAAQRAVACFYPTDGFVSRPGLGVPEDVATSYALLRRLVDFEPLDEEQVLHGALDRVACLIWLQSASVAPGVLAALERWVRDGGVLVDAAPHPPRTREAPDTNGSAGTAGTPHDASGAGISGGGGGGATGAPCATGEADDHAGAALLEGREAAAGALRYRLGAPPRVALQLADDAARPFLGRGWLDRENGVFAWPDAGVTVPTRWAGGEAHLVLPRPPGERLRITVDLHVFGPLVADGTPVTLSELRAGRREPLAALTGLGTHRITAELAPPADAPAVRIAIASKTFRPCEHHDSAQDRRELGVLVRQVRLEPVGAQGGSGEAAASGDGRDPASRASDAAGGSNGAARADEADGRSALRHVELGDIVARAAIDVARSGAAVRRLGRGVVLRGDGTPLSALAWLASWLAGEVDGHAPPALARDAAGGCLVTAFDGGMLAHNPDPVRPRRVRLTAGGGERELELAPLETRWLPRTGVANARRAPAERAG